MRNELDEIYADYKRGGSRNSNVKNSSRNENHTTHGVPSPFMDGDLETDFTKVRCCNECGSMNVSMDMSTNKTVCKDCKKSSDTPNRVDFQKKMEQEKERELKVIEDALQRGDTFGTAR